MPKQAVHHAYKRSTHIKALALDNDALRAELDSLRSSLATSQFDLHGLREEADQLKAERDSMLFGWPPGHFYSPIPDLNQIRQREAHIFSTPRLLPGINLNEEEQINLFHSIKHYYDEQPFHDDKHHNRYCFDNPNYSYGEALILYCMIRYLQPKRIIEIGSGYSSCVSLDTNELFFRNGIACTFIDPYPELLLSLLKQEDTEKINIIQKDLQDIDIKVFSELSAGDILFIDSTHVSKVNSDVNYILFKLLPSLNPGVYIHFHDIPYPFEYPREWIYQGRAWNEAYALHGFLQYNHTFIIRFFNSFMGAFHSDLFTQTMPLFLHNPGTSIWLKKV